MLPVAVVLEFTIHRYWSDPPGSHIKPFTALAKQGGELVRADRRTSPHICSALKLTRPCSTRTGSQLAPPSPPSPPAARFSAALNPSRLQSTLHCTAACVAAPPAQIFIKRVHAAQTRIISTERQSTSLLTSFVILTQPMPSPSRTANKNKEYLLPGEELPELQ